MVRTFGSDIEKVFTNGEPVEAIYAEGVKVWPDNPTPSGGYYIKWWPKDVSGSFIIGGEARWLQDYSGYYSGPFLSIRYAGQSSSEYYIDSRAFEGTGVVAVETNLKLIGAHAFESCQSLVYVSAPQCSSFMRVGEGGTGTYTFRNCNSLREVYFNNVSWVGTYTFTGCQSLIYVSIPKCGVIGEWAFMSCYALPELVLPSCYTLDNDVFPNCSSLSVVTLPVCSYIGESAFYSCSNLQYLTLGYSGVCSISGALIPSRTNIYVPLEWVSEYQSAYPSMSSHIFPIPHE